MREKKRVWERECEREWEKEKERVWERTREREVMTGERETKRDKRMTEKVGQGSSRDLLCKSKNCQSPYQWGCTHISTNSIM